LEPGTGQKPKIGGMLFDEPTNSTWAQSNIFLEYFAHINKISKKIFFDTQDKIFAHVERYFVTCSWMNKYLWMKMRMKTKWMNFLNESQWEISFSWKIEQKKQGEIFFYVGLFWIIQDLKCLNHISYFLDILYIKLCSV